MRNDGWCSQFIRKAIAQGTSKQKQGLHRNTTCHALGAVELMQLISIDSITWGMLKAELALEAYAEPDLDCLWTYRTSVCGRVS